MVVCTACAHPWGEHAGTPHEIADPTVCGECVYELEHGFRQLPACELQVPEAIAGPATDPARRSAERGRRP